MNLIVSNSSESPIYSQIYSQLRNKIIDGTLQSGEPLPSIRNLAKDLRISVITTKRAYDELEKDGFIYTVAGKGCFVADKNLDFIREERLKEIENHIKKIYELSVPCGITKEEVIEMFNLLSEEK